MPDVMLEPAELAVLLTLLGVQSVPGAEIDILFPNGAGGRQAILDQGMAALQQHGHLAVVDGRFDERVNPLLLAMAVISAPRKVILTTRYGMNGEQRLLHYIAEDLVVEFYITPERNCRLVSLESENIAQARIEGLFAVNLTSEGRPMSLSMSAPSLARLMQLALGRDWDGLTNLLTDIGADGSQTGGLLERLEDLELLGSVDLAWMESRELKVQQSLMLFAAGGGFGLVQFYQSGSASLTIPAVPAFGNLMRDGLLALSEAGRPQPRGRGSRRAVESE